MKRMTKKLGAVALALVMCFSLCATALAASSTDTGKFSITVENSSYGKEYNAYKIFDVTYSNEDEDGNVNYAYTIHNTCTTTSAGDITVENSNAWYELFTGEVKDADGNVLSCPFEFTKNSNSTSTTTTTAEGTVTVEDNYYNVTVKSGFDETDIVNYLNAAISSIATYNEDTGEWTIKDSRIKAANAQAVVGTGSEISIPVEEAGYYFVTSSLGAVVSVTTTDPNPTIFDKNSELSIEKKMVHKDEETGDVKEDTAEADGMGETVNFDVTAVAPIAEGENYVLDYTITDSLTNGLLIELTDDQFTYDATTGKYYLDKNVINEWITLYTGEYADLDDDGELEPVAVVGDFTDYVYDWSFELIDHDVYTDDITGETYHTFSGFVLTYYTYNVEQYKVDLYAALLAAYPDSINDMWPDYPESWPSSVPEDFDFDSESYFEAYDAVSNLVGTKYPANATLEIEYTANVSSLEGYENTNTITMEHEYTPFSHPTPWSPTPGDKIYAKDYVYSWELQILKITADGEETPLQGATFTLESNNMQDVKVGHSYLYVPLSAFVNGVYTASDGTKYNYADFESTRYVATKYDSITNEPIEWAVGEGTSDNDTYVRILTSDAKVEDTTTTHTATGTTDKNGMLYFEGLGTGVFTLTEITAPDGYNLLKDPIIFEITFEETGNEEEGYKGVFTVTYGSIDGNGNFVADTGNEYNGTLSDNYILVETIENSTGTELPSTGGIGTTIFYIIGGILVVGAVVVLVTRRRMTRES